MKLSIITINRNNSEGLRKTINSVVSQTFTDCEFIVIDGASTDSSVDIIKEYAAKGLRGVIHCYSGSAAMALDYIEMGFYIGIGGVITFENTKKLKDVVKAIPIEHLLIETDAPYLAPVPHRGKRNDSNYLNLIATRIAEIKEIQLERVTKSTYENAYNLFSIDSK